MQQETRASLEGVLTAEQMNKLDQKMRESAKSDEKEEVGLLSTSIATCAHRSDYFTGIGFDRVTGTAVTLFCGLPSIILSEYVR